MQRLYQTGAGEGAAVPREGSGRSRDEAGIARKQPHGAWEAR